MPTINPLQMALAAGTISAKGMLSAPRLVLAVDTYQSGWIILYPQSKPLQVLDSGAANEIAQAHAIPDMSIWQRITVFEDISGKSITWYLGGTLQSLESDPYAVALILEEENPDLAERIGQTILSSMMLP